MLELFSKPLEEMKVDDIRALVSLEVPEGERLEFKRELPGEGGKTDPWVGGGKIGSYAKEKILEEVVGFANAYGGVLVIGIDESDTKPSIATKITPVPRCADLADRLRLVFRDCVEPELVRIEIEGVQTEDDESGVVLIRVGKSRLAPHRVRPTRVCPIRRADRKQEMTMLDIQNMTLNVSRGLERLRKRLGARRRVFRKEFSRLKHEKLVGFRVTGVPVADEIRFERVFDRGEIIEKFKVPEIKVFRENGEQRIPFSGPILRWQPSLRSARAEFEYDCPPYRPYFCYQELHCDGLVECGWVEGSSREEPFWVQSDPFVAMFANLCIWADQIRREDNAVALEYALEAEIRILGQVGIDDGHGHSKYFPEEQSKVRFPTYSLNERDQIKELLTQFNCDFWNSMGKDVGDVSYFIGE